MIIPVTLTTLRPRTQRIATHIHDGDHIKRIFGSNPPSLAANLRKVVDAVIPHAQDPAVDKEAVRSELSRALRAFENDKPQAQRKYTKLELDYIRVFNRAAIDKETSAEYYQGDFGVHYRHTSETRMNLSRAAREELESCLELLNTPNFTREVPRDIYSNSGGYTESLSFWGGDRFCRRLVHGDGSGHTDCKVFQLPPHLRKN